MNAEALLGTVLGRCAIQKLIGQGGMGAVYLAQQSRPRRLVAVKVLLPMVPLSPHQLAAFLERFRRETDAAAALEHPHIMPVYEYGENDGIAYLVMPYISGGTLRDELEREGPLALPKVVNYLEQVAAALDFAHEHGVIHRDIKPANIMVTQDERLLLTDFGLVKIMSDSQIPQSPMRLTGAGAPVGTPDYMAPEQVIGDEVDTRADLYSLGVILYQMVTGTTPFHGETPMQIAAQHLQIPPPSPQMLRPDLPISAEQVILRALAKRPADRYMRADSMARDFRQAIMGTGVPLEENYTRSGMLLTASRLPVPEISGRTAPRGQLTSARQSMNFPTMDQPAQGLFRQTGTLSSTRSQEPVTQANAGLSTAGGGLLSRTGKFPMVGGTGILPVASSSVAGSGGSGLLSRTGKFPMVGDSSTAPPAMTTNAPTLTTNVFGQSYLSSSTGALAASEPARAKDTVKLTGAMKVVKVPVAGQPGHFVTGLLPVAPMTPESLASAKKKTGLGKKLALLIAVVLVVIGSLGTFWLVSKSGGMPGMTQNVQKPLTVAQVKATSVVNATATAVAYNTILTDALDHNIHGWQTQPASAFAFKNGAYYVTDDQQDGRAVILPINALPTKLVYTLTMQEVQGNDTSDVNSFGMIFRLTQSARPGSDKPISKFYSFEVVNKKAGAYQFWKYDDTNANAVPWTMVQDGNLLHIGNEFHQGQGAQAVNTISIAMDGGNFTVTVNSTKLPKVFQDNSYTNGSVGMIVNEQGTQVAFKNLFLTRQ